MFLVKIFVSLKESVLDPQGMAILNALHEMEMKQVQDVRIGKFIQVKLNTNDKNQAKTMVEEMCKKLLVNDVIETYSFEIHDIN